MAAYTLSIHVFLGRPPFLLSRGIQSIINFGTRNIFSYTLNSINLINTRLQPLEKSSYIIIIINSHALEGPLFLCFAFETYITYLQNFLSARKFTSQNEITTWTLIPYSRAILGYLVEQYAKDDSLFPKNPKKRAVVNQMLYFDATTLHQRISDYYVSNVQILFKMNGSYINTCCILLQPMHKYISKYCHRQQ